MLVETFLQSLSACGGEASRAAGGEVADALVDLLGRDRTVVVTPDLESLRAVLSDRGLDCRVASREAAGTFLEEDLRGADVAITSGLVGVARSGSVGVGPGGGNGGLLAALVPRHVVLLYETAVVETLAQALGVVAGAFDRLGGEVVFVTGPSRTADIEMMSVVGVHGPLSLHVLLVAGEVRA